MSRFNRQNDNNNNDDGMDIDMDIDNNNNNNNIEKDNNITTSTSSKRKQATLDKLKNSKILNNKEGLNYDDEEKEEKEKGEGKPENITSITTTTNTNAITTTTTSTTTTNNSIFSEEINQDPLQEDVSTAACATKSIEGWLLIATNIDEEATEEDVEDFFNEFGVVRNLHLNLDRRTGYVKGYALIEYKTVEEAQAAVLDGDGSEFLNRIINVDFAIVKPSNNKSSSSDIVEGNSKNNNENLSSSFQRKFDRPERIDNGYDDDYNNNDYDDDDDENLISRNNNNESYRLNHNNNNNRNNRDNQGDNSRDRSRLIRDRSRSPIMR